LSVVARSCNRDAAEAGVQQVTVEEVTARPGTTFAEWGVAHAARRTPHAARRTPHAARRTPHAARRTVPLITAGRGLAEGGQAAVSKVTATPSRPAIALASYRSQVRKWIHPLSLR
jgi:hypothetical protein